MNWRHGFDLKFGRYKLQVCHGFGGRDRYLWVEHNSILWAWSAPKWLSFMRHDGRLRGG